MGMRLLRLVIVVPLLILLWGYSNALGLTGVFTRALDLPRADWWTLPGVERIVELKDGSPEQQDQLITEVWTVAEPFRDALSDENRARARTALDDMLDGFGADAGAIDFKQPDIGAASPYDYGSKSDYRDALAVLTALPAKGRAPLTGYDRDQFGAPWDDDAGNFSWTGNGCDTRNDLLRRDLTGERADGCKVLSGDLADPYTGTDIYFVYGDGNLVDAEHVVALGNSWVTGSSGWTEAKRAALANDPLNLLAVDAGANRQKGDADAATWLPPNKPFRCAYVSRQIAVKAKYGLWVTPAEKDAMRRVLRGCVN
ncbi:hypothetical protein GCM10027273_10090 [Nocardioides pakistanensis]